MSEQQPGRYRRSAGGLVGALLVLLAVVLGFVVLRDLNRADPVVPTRDVDYTRTAELARTEAGFELLAPPSLPEGWRATSVDFRRGPAGGWHLGMLTDEDQYVGLEQSTGSPRSMVESHVDPQARPAGPVTVAGERWRTWTDDAGDLALVRQEADTTTLVVGNDVPRAELVGFAASLR